MTASLHVLHSPASPIGAFLRVGHTGHRKLEAMLAGGRFPYRRVVFDAAHFDEQADLAKALIDGGREVILDPNFAEMATLGRFGSSSISKLPWSNPDRPWTPADFGRGRNIDVAALIADYVVARNVSAVLSPSHLISQPNDEWTVIDRSLCEALRAALDRAGGRDVAVDHQIIVTAGVLKEGGGREALIEQVEGLPIQNVWLRTSGFGATATGVGTRGFIEAVRDLHRMQRPLVADAAGGLPGLAAAAFGAVGGISHGVGQKESFKGSDWSKPMGKGGGSSTRVYVPELDRHFDEIQLESLLVAKGGRSRFGCNDARCCPHGSDDMKENAHAHFIYQRHRQIDDLSSVPDSKRAAHFMLRHMDPAVRSSRHGARLKIMDPQVADAVGKAKARLERLQDALVDLQGNIEDGSRSRAPFFRGGSRSFSAVLGA